MALCRRAPPLADSIERLRCRSRQSGERLSLRREAAEVERPDSSEVGESIENEGKQVMETQKIESRTIRKPVKRYLKN